MTQSESKKPINSINANKFFSLGGGQNAHKMHQQKRDSKKRGSSLRMVGGILNQNVVPIESKHKQIMMRSTDSQTKIKVVEKQA